MHIYNNTIICVSSSSDAVMSYSDEMHLSFIVPFINEDCIHVVFSYFYQRRCW